jgi:bifunctional isochorismate lyase/aryl carrier protein
LGIPAIAAYPPPRTETLSTEWRVPANRVDWRPDPARAVLLVHDMQHYFVDRFEGEPLHGAIEAIGRLRKRCADLSVPVVYTAQPGGQTPRSRGLLTDFWGPGLPADPHAESIVDSIAPGPDDVLLTKHRYSAFAKTELAEVMGGRDQLVITGVYAHIGVIATACDAFMRDLQAFVVADAVADFSAAHHRDALAYAATRCGVVLTAEEVFA